MRSGSAHLRHAALPELETLPTLDPSELEESWYSCSAALCDKDLADLERMLLRDMEQYLGVTSERRPSSESASAAMDRKDWNRREAARDMLRDRLWRRRFSVASVARSNLSRSAATISCDKTKHLRVHAGSNDFALQILQMVGPANIVE